MVLKETLEKYTFTKEDTQIMKAVAIGLMLIHHIAYEGRIADDATFLSLTIFDGVESAFYIGRFGKICVSLFMFCGGIGTYKIFQEKRNIFDRIWNLYIRYWKIFIIFIPLGFLCFSNQPDYCTDVVICHVFEKFDIIELMANFIGVDYTYCREWWFLIDYVIVLITFWIWGKLISKHTFAQNVFGVIIYNIFLEAVIPTLANTDLFKNLQYSYLFQMFISQKAPYVSCFWMGCALAKDNVLERIRELLYEKKVLNILSDVVGLIFVVVIRQSIIGGSVDMFLVVALTIFATDLVKRIHASRLLIVVGKKSTNMWLIHAFFCYYFYPFAKFVYSFQYALCAWILLMILTYTVSVLIDIFYDSIEKLMMNIFNKL